jgi:hypothetical protein
LTYARKWSGRTRKVFIASIVMDPLQNLLCRIRGTCHIVNPDTPSFKFNNIGRRSNLFGED